MTSGAGRPITLRGEYISNILTASAPLFGLSGPPSTRACPSKEPSQSGGQANHGEEVGCELVVASGDPTEAMRWKIFSTMLSLALALGHSEADGTTDGIDDRMDFHL
jgi:hypothetical protein